MPDLSHADPIVILFVGIAVGAIAVLLGGIIGVLTGMVGRPRIREIRVVEDVVKDAKTGKLASDIEEEPAPTLPRVVIGSRRSVPPTPGKPMSRTLVEALLRRAIHPVYSLMCISRHLTAAYSASRDLAGVD